MIDNDIDIDIDIDIVDFKLSQSLFSRDGSWLNVNMIEVIGPK